MEMGVGADRRRTSVPARSEDHELGEARSTNISFGAGLPASGEISKLSVAGDRVPILQPYQHPKLLDSSAT